MHSDPMDVVIGAGSASHRDFETARRHLTAASNLISAGEKAGAISEYRRALAADPENTDAMFHLAYLLDLVGEEDEALSLYERVTDSQPAPVNALLNLAVMYEDRGDYVRAERCVRQVLETNPNHVRARLFMKDIQASREMMVEEESDRDLLKKKALFDTPVTDFELSVRARTCLKKMNIRTLGDLLRITEAELTAHRNFGDASLAEIKAMLAQRGLKLGQAAARQQDAAKAAVYEQLKTETGSSDEVLYRGINELDLSVRSRKALALLGVATIGDLCLKTEAELMGVKNFGSTSLVEIKSKLAEVGLSLRKLDDSFEE